MVSSSQRCPRVGLQSSIAKTHIPSVAAAAGSADGAASGVASGVASGAASGTAYGAV